MYHENTGYLHTVSSDANGCVSFRGFFKGRPVSEPPTESTPSSGVLSEGLIRFKGERFPLLSSDGCWRADMISTLVWSVEILLSSSSVRSCEQEKIEVSSTHKSEDINLRSFDRWVDHPTWLPPLWKEKYSSHSETLLPARILMGCIAMLSIPCHFPGLKVKRDRFLRYI